ncbi:unnamed protein product [Rhizophagus irregularis]|nr:unnamed protein product [Rhizophagus irregularis]
MGSNASIPPQRSQYSSRNAELWKRHEKAEEAYDRAAEKWEKANDALGQLFEEEGIGNRELRELGWKAYHKACEERKEARKEHRMVRRALERFGFVD